MKRRDIVELLALAALWGASFLFMRIAAPAFGPIGLASVRVAGAAVLLVPILALRGELGWMRRRWRSLSAVGLLNSALPFACFAYAALATQTGVLAIFNSASPLFAAVVAWWWLGQRPTRWRVVGLGVGFIGVALIALTRLDGAQPDGLGGGLVVLACIAATLCYGISPSLTRRYLSDVPPLAVAAGSQVAASLLLAVPAALLWPATPPAPSAWLAAAALACFCTGIAYVLYFRLIASAGPTNAIAVTYLVPLFALLWGGLILGERLTWRLVIACAIIFAGTALATGVLAPATLARKAKVAA